MPHIFLDAVFCCCCFCCQRPKLIAYWAISQNSKENISKTWHQSSTIYLYKYIQFKLFNLTEILFILCKYFWNLCGHLSDPYDNCNNIIKWECVVVILFDFVEKLWESCIALLHRAIIAINEIIKEESEEEIINWRIKKKEIPRTSFCWVC